MSDVHTDIAATPTIDQPLSISRKPIAVQGRNGKTLRMTRRVKTAIDLMVWEAAKRDDAAKAVGLQPKSLYAAISKADVRAYYLAQCEVLRTSGRARRIHRLEQMAEQDDNKQAAVNAIRALDNISDEQQQAATRSQSPGFAIVIMDQRVAAQPAPRIIEHVAPVIDRASTVDRE